MLAYFIEIYIISSEASTHHYNFHAKVILEHLYNN